MLETRDLRGRHLNRATFTSVRIERAALNAVAFQAATLRAGYQRGHAALRTADFDGARLEELTYTGLNGMGAKLSNVTVE